MVRRLTLVPLLLFAILGGGAAAQAAEPPNQNDPCSRNGRNTCGTNGEGSYRNYRYGVRWFGDYRRASTDVSGGTFCIDLRFWYPSKSFDYEERSAAGLRNKESEAVSARQAAADEPRAVAVRALGQRRPAGRGDGLRAPVDGRRGAGRGRPEGAVGGEPLGSTRRWSATPSASPGPYKVRATLPDSSSPARRPS